VNGSVAFAIQTFQINPGLANVFPWLSAQASGYESYKVNSLHVEYRFTTNEFIGLGRIVIAPDYDAADDPPVSIVEAEQMADCVMGAVAKNWTCTLRPRGIGILGPKRYTRSATLAPELDIKTYYIAQVHVCTQGQTDGAEIGQLWLNYDITLSEPQPISPGNILSSGSLINIDGSGGATTALLGTDPTEAGTLVLRSVGIVVNVRGLVTGQGYVAFLDTRAATVTGAPVLSFSNGASANTNYGPTLTSLIGTVRGVAVYGFLAMDTQCDITMSGVTVLTTPSYSSLQVMGSSDLTI